MSKISVNLQKSIKPMKKMHAGGQPPLRGADTSMFKYLSDAGIPYSRLHDVGGAFGSNRYVDIPNIFRDFNADVNDPASYDFTFTDFLIKALVDAGIEPYYRLGVTIENQCAIKPYYIYPPKECPCMSVSRRSPHLFQCLSHARETSRTLQARTEGLPPSAGLP